MSVTGCIDDENNNISYVEYSLDFIFTPINEIEFFILIPCPMFQDEIDNGFLLKIADLDIEYAIEDTSYGKAINFSSDSKIIISQTFKLERDTFDYSLSLQNSTRIYGQAEFMLYSSVGGTINYNLNIESDYNRLGYSFDSIIGDNWQTINCTILKHKKS